ncbi:uncharacterized protein MELLADRAFT_94366 [Melampsora larici-populina 98AG31]|uniref:Uncharacterized protein n=1 Tax=Melampsora larici-populina (strain 98AG31 / pathotype 3-4-7) TaxID=747676 RepID=F4RB87_MELLP|nr:uncharacterized protein MELLADRAFT_94366 [Melampsora larici-populina 98AG31]EGG10400.1 hypothetical protein MELLADRAFT_94366 [Melampsora larici-populina 98AG31]
MILPHRRDLAKWRWQHPTFPFGSIGISRGSFFSKSRRRSSRPSPARIRSQMIEVPSDSRRTAQRHYDPSDSESSVYQPPSSSKRKRDDPPTEDEHSDHSQSLQPRHKAKNPTKSSSQTRSKRCRQVQSDLSQQAQGSDNIASSQAVPLQVDLIQDSDGENAKVAKKPKKEHTFDNIRDYFNEMTTVINFNSSF